MQANSADRLEGAHPQEIEQMGQFFDAHAQDLTASGITLETAKEAGLFSAEGLEVAKKLNFSLPQDMTCLMFPYANGDGFFRAKLFPPLAGKNSTMRYAQPKASGVHLYIPPSVQGELKNPATAIMITEGEKKALKACQEGFACLGIGGLWNWIHDGQPIPDLDGIAWADRSVVIVPDSDVWARPNLIQAVYALGAELENRGARVDVLLLPQDGERKVGLDDYFVAHGLDNFHELKRLNLKHKTFSKAKTWHKEWLKKREASEPLPAARKLLDQIKQVRHLHPAQDFASGLIWFGVPIENQVVLINSERRIIRGDQLPDGLELSNSDFNLCRFSKEGITQFLAGENISGKELASELRNYFQRYLVINDRRIFLLLTLWAMGTYLYRIFRVYPYLSLRSPTKECAKSRTEDLLSCICFNASNRETSPTEATMFRGPAKNGGTILLDEIEGLRSDRDRFGNLLSILNSGFESGGSVTRMEKRGEKFMDVSYPTFCPRVLAGINRLADTLEGRSITLFLSRKLRTERVERFSKSRQMETMQSTRDRLYIWALTHAGDLARVYDRIDSFEALEGLGDRERDLWEPLVSIALLCDSEGAATRELTDELCSLAQDLSKLRGEIDTANVIQVLGRLEDLLGSSQEIKISPSDLLKHFKEDSYFEWLKSTKALAGLLAPLGLISGNHRYPETGKVTRMYKIHAETIKDRKIRYGRGE